MTRRAIEKKPKKQSDDFKSVAKRLGCDPDLKAFDKKLGEIARAKSKTGKAK